jgi:hypothetical protein
MDPLSVVEEELGSIESWPTSFITDMFYGEVKVSVKSRVAAFMYGNGVNVSDLVKLYKTFNREWRDVAETRIYGSYFMWKLWVTSRIENIFSCDMKKKCVIWLRREECVTPEIFVSDF